MYHSTVFLILTHFIFSIVAIYDGKEASLNEFPYLVSLRDETDHFCAGVIISDKHIVTVKYCLPNSYPYDKIKAELNIVAGTNDILEESLVYKIDEIYDYNEWEFKKPGDYHNLVVLKVKERINLENSRVEKIDLPNQPLVANASKHATFAGWGFIDNRYGRPEKLQKINVDVTSNDDECYAKIKVEVDLYHPPNEFCTIAMQEACEGDNGGALINDDGALIGILIYGDYECNGAGVNVYLNVYEYLDFLLDVLKKV